MTISARRAAMRRHPAGKGRTIRHTGVTVIPFPSATIDPTATAENTTEKGTDND